MKILLVLLMAVSLVSCFTKRVSTVQTDHSKLVSEWRELAFKYEKRVEIYRDSMMLVKGMMEKSSNVADSASYLETSYAKSDAAIRNGRLHHSIENKDSVPGTVKYVHVEVERRDTVRVERRDTVFYERKVNKEVVKEKRLLWNAFFYASGWIAWVVAVVGAGIWLRYKVKRGGG